MADDPEPQWPAPGEPGPSEPGPSSRPPEAQAVLDGVYERAAAIRRRRGAWVGVGAGLAAVVVVAGLVVLVPDRSPDGVLTADLADSTAPSSETTEEPPTTGTTNHTESTLPTSVTSATTFAQDPTTAPDDTATTSAPPDTEPPPTSASTVPANGAPTIEIVSVSPTPASVGREVTVEVRVVDHDTVLDECGHTWGQSAGESAGYPSPSCPTPMCGPDAPRSPPSGSTDRTDTFTYTYSADGVYEFVVAYAGGECTEYWDEGEISTKIRVG